MLFTFHLLKKNYSCSFKQIRGLHFILFIVWPDKPDGERIRYIDLLGWAGKMVVRGLLELLNISPAKNHINP
jgi:hypothetical protein